MAKGGFFMMKKTLEAIAMQLKREFGEHYEIWIEEQEQDLKEPCFFVQAIETHQVAKLTGNYQRSQSFDLIYFPETKATFELTEVAERLYFCMEYIELDGIRVRGRNLHTEIVEGVLHFMVDYEICLKEGKEKEDKMEYLKQKGRLK